MTMKGYLIMEPLPLGDQVASWATLRQLRQGWPRQRWTHTIFEVVNMPNENAPGMLAGCSRPA